MSVPQCVRPGNFNSTNNPLLPVIKNACILGGPIDINDAALKAAHYDCCQGDSNGIVRENSCYLVCEVNQVYTINKYEKCIDDKYENTPAPKGIMEQCFGALVEDPQASVDTLTGTPIATDTGGASASQTRSISTATAPSETTISLSPTSSLTVSSVIVGGTPKPTASFNSSTLTSGSNSSSTGSASPSATSPPSKASRGSISMSAVFVVGLAFLGLMI